MVEVTCLRTWATNVGNLFIDLGSIQSLKMAVPQSKVHNVSGSARRLFEDRYYGLRKKIMEKIMFTSAIGKPIIGRERWDYHVSRVHDWALKADKSLENLFDLGLYMKADYAVISGCVLNDYTVRRYGSTLLNLKRKNVKIIFNGVGGSSYRTSELNIIRKFLRKIKPYAFISRDVQAFKNYQDLARYSYNGVDCAFFVNDFFQPVELELPKYAVLTFDQQPEPNLRLDYDLIIRTHHKLLGRIPKEYFDKPNTLISDSVEDYFNIYANADVLHSDRVHACVATLSFGRACKLYHETVRSLLLDRVGLEEIKIKIVYPDTYRIEKEKGKQITFLSEILSV